MDFVGHWRSSLGVFDMITSFLNASYPGCAAGEHGLIKASRKTCSMIELLILECVTFVEMVLVGPLSLLHVL